MVKLTLCPLLPVMQGMAMLMLGTGHWDPPSRLLSQQHESYLEDERDRILPIQRILRSLQRLQEMNKIMVVGCSNHAGGNLRLLPHQWHEGYMSESRRRTGL